MRLPELPSTRAHRHQARARRRLELAAELAQVARLQRDLGVARRRYQRAITGLGERLPENGGASELAPRPHLFRATEPIQLRDAGFEDLRSLGLSVTQANRVLKLVESGDVVSLGDLDRVPGIPRGQLAELKLALNG